MLKSFLSEESSWEQSLDRGHLSVLTRKIFLAEENNYQIFVHSNTNQTLIRRYLELPDERKEFVMEIQAYASHTKKDLIELWCDKNLKSLHG